MKTLLTKLESWQRMAEGSASEVVHKEQDPDTPRFAYNSNNNNTNVVLHLLSKSYAVQNWNERRITLPMNFLEVKSLEIAGLPSFAHETEFIFWLADWRQLKKVSTYDELYPSKRFLKWPQLPRHSLHLLKKNKTWRFKASTQKGHDESHIDYYIPTIGKTPTFRPLVLHGPFYLNHVATYPHT